MSNFFKRKTEVSLTVRIALLEMDLSQSSLLGSVVRTALKKVWKECLLKSNSYSLNSLKEHQKFNC